MLIISDPLGPLGKGAEYDGLIVLSHACILFYSIQSLFSDLGFDTEAWGGEIVRT